MTQAIKITSLPHRLNTFFGLSIQIIGTVFATRLIIDTGVRIIYPFIPQISAGLGLTVVGFGWLIFVRSIVGVTGPISGVLADKIGRRKIMAAALLCQGMGLLGLALSWQWWAILPMLPFGLGLTAFIPAGQAYISDKVAYQKRGRVLGAIEFSWALAGIVALPVIGWLIEIFGWRSPFLVLSIFSLIGALFVWVGLPAVEHRATVGLSWSDVQRVCLRSNVLASIVASLMLFVTVSSFITMWGIWLSEGFGLGAAALGFVATGIGFAELTGSGLSTLFIDRLGKRRGSLLGLLLLALFFLLLPVTQVALGPAIAGLVFMGTLLEFSVVSLISLYSEQAPEARATVFSLIMLGASMGIAFGAPITTTLWARAGLWAICLVAATSALIAFSLVWQFLQEPEDLSSTP